MVAAVAADEADARAVLVREHSPAVDLLLVDPAVAVKRLPDKRRGHGRVAGQHEWSFYAKGPRPARTGRAEGKSG